MRNHAFLKVVLLGLLTFALVPGIAGAGGGIGPVIDVSPGTGTFGTVNSGECWSIAVGGGFEYSFTITNVGDADLTVSSITTAAPFSVGAGFTNGTILPGGSETVNVDFCPMEGGYAPGSLTIESDAVNGSPTWDVFLEGNGNTRPQFTPPVPVLSYSLTAFVPFSQTWFAHDDQTDPMTWTLTGLEGIPGPFFSATATDPSGNSSATLEWTPSPLDVRTYSCTLSVSDGLLTTSAVFDLDVAVTNTPPVAEPGGPYTGVRTVPIHFDGTGSTDVDGTIATWAWNFGDGNFGTGATVDHAYDAIGTFLATLTVTDNGIPALSNTCPEFPVTIVNFIPVQVTAKLSKGAIKTFGGGLQQIGAELSPISGLNALDIDPASIRLSVEGQPGEISPVPGKGSNIGDLDGDRIQELISSFTRADLATIAAGSTNNTIVHWLLTGKTVAAKGSVPIRGVGDYLVKLNGGPAPVSSFAAPNPFNPETSINYTLRNPGTVSIRIYSVNGQLVRSLREEFANPGTYEVRWNGTDDSGRPVRSGIYFVNVVQGANESHNKVVVAK